MKTVFSRNQNGIVQTESGTFKVPANQSVFSAITAMPIYDGDDLTQDPHWIINTKGAPKRKRFVFGQVYEDQKIQVWSRKMERDYLSTLEAKYHYMNTVVKVAGLKIWSDAVRAVVDAGGSAHAIPYNSEQNGGMIWLYDVHYDEGYKCHTVGFKWVDHPKHLAKPTSLIHPNLGQNLYAADKRSGQIISRVNMFRSVLLRHFQGMISNYCKEGGFRNEQRVFMFTVNGREYCVLLTPRKYGCSYDLIEPVRFTV